MNKAILIGRLTADPVVKQTPNNITVCSFTVAVDRKFKDQNGNKQTDFITCVAWRGQAEVIGNYFSRGSRIGITGSIQTRSYEDAHGQKRQVVEIMVEEIEFLDTKKETAPAEEPVKEQKKSPKAEPIVMPDTDDDSYGLPFDVCGY